MKRWLITVVCLLTLAASLPETAEAQEKDTMRVVTEVVTRSSYTEPLPLGEIGIRLSGPDNRTLGYGSKRYKPTEILTVSREANRGNGVTWRSGYTLLRVESAYNWLNPRTSRFQKVLFRLTLSAPGRPDKPGASRQWGHLELIYPGNVVRQIGLNDSVTVTGTSLKQGYVLRGTVPGENGDETLTVSFNLRGTGS